MADSNIIIATLTAKGGTQQVMLDFFVPDLEPLPYLQFDVVEIWSAATNNRAGATKVGEGQGRQFAHTGLATSTTRYYWARPVNRSGLLGEWFPVSATGGVSATTSSNALGPNSVGPTELQPGAVGNVHMQANSITANEVTIASLSALSSILGTVQAATIISGSVSGVTITASTFTGGVFRTATSGRRVEINGSTNRVDVYDAGGSFVGSFGNGYSGDTTLYITKNSVSTAAYIQNTSTGGALTAVGRVYFASAVSGFTALEVISSSGGSTAHAIRGNNSGGGGAAVLGASSAGGGFGVVAERGGFGPFTGQHDGFISKDADALPGDIVIDTGEILAVRGIDDAVGINAIADKVADCRVYGVVSSRVPFEHDALVVALDPLDRVLRRQLAARYDRITINSLGEGLINVCGRGGDNIAAGGLVVSSDLPGAGQKQGDDVMRASTVAKLREAVRFTSPDQVKRIACTYHCG